MSVEQVSDFILGHRHTVREFDFENVGLINGGTWEDALAPLTRFSGSDEWLSSQSGSEADSNTSFQGHSDLDLLNDIAEEFEEVVDTSAAMPHDGDGDMPRTSVQVKKRVRKRRRKHKRTRAGLKISSPIPISGPIEEVLQPTTFNPNIQGVQRNVRMEAAQQALADDPEKRVSALKKAKETILKRLGKEFYKNQDKKDGVRGFFNNTCAASWRSRAMMMHESSSALVPLMFSRC